jgi:hypothetical protein
MKVVALALPLKLTTESETKFVPSTVRVKPAPPAITDVGEVSIVVGTGLLTVKVWVEDAPPPGAGVTTVNRKVPAAATSVAGTMAVI